MQKTPIRIIFVTLFLDLVGFSIIFPLFPAIADYYLGKDPNDPLMQLIFAAIHKIAAFSGASESVSPIVLFGGILGALYSFLQFVAAPFWGALSDRVGRRPVLLLTISGIAASYLLWFLSGSFTLLVIARALGGAMSGNISAATAAISDITTSENRARGMAVVGIAFALGFILGPAVGGISAHYNLLAHFPQWEVHGVNPFSAPALISLSLSLLNLAYVFFAFKETWVPNAVEPTTRSANPLRLFAPLPHKGVNRTNWAYFLFLVIFSGMEFTLTFLAVERLAYTPMKNAAMFIYIGLVIVLVQGGFVRRQARVVGEKKMALLGLALIIPGLSITGLALSTSTLYLGLTFLAMGAAMVIPCLTALASLYSPAAVQGRALGVFRSLGALARVIGPFAASMVYWRFGSAVPYIAGALALSLPLGFVGALPPLNPPSSAAREI